MMRIIQESCFVVCFVVVLASTDPINIGIIGAGIGSASAVHYITNSIKTISQPHFNPQKKTHKLSSSSTTINVDIFEQNGWIGGRENETYVTMSNNDNSNSMLNDGSYFVETGATIMIYGNEMVYNFSKLLNLTIVDGGTYSNETNSYNLGFYNFEKNTFKFITTSNISSLNHVTFEDLKRDVQFAKHFGLEI